MCVNDVRSDESLSLLKFDSLKDFSMIEHNTSHYISWTFSKNLRSLSEIFANLHKKAWTAITDNPEKHLVKLILDPNCVHQQFIALLAVELTPNLREKIGKENQEESFTLHKRIKSLRIVAWCEFGARWWWWKFQTRKAFLCRKRKATFNDKSSMKGSWFLNLKNNFFLLKLYTFSRFTRLHSRVLRTQKTRQGKARRKCEIFFHRNSFKVSCFCCCIYLNLVL